MILSAIPYDGARDLARTWNAVFARLRPGDWAILLDHDVFLTSSTWFQLVERAIAEKPDAGMFCAVTNRLPSRRSGWQVVDAPKSDDLDEHRAFGTALAKGPLLLSDVTTPTIAGRPAHLASGFFLAISRDVAVAEGPLKEGGNEKGLDWELHRRVARAGKRVYLIEGLYVYHWCPRGRVAFEGAAR